MLRALELATYAIKNCRPNPAVGAIVVKNGIAVGKGYTQEPGNAHAEIVALNMAGENAKDAELFVTLEPCSHYGRTPPCADSIIKAGIKKVCYGYIDPNPTVAGKGIDKLKEAGIEVEKNNLNGLIDEFYESYAWFVKNKTPFVTVKIAQTMDGFIANSNRTPVKITGEQSQTKLHRLRSFCDAIVIGKGTQRSDNPQLTVRKVAGANPQKIIFSRDSYDNWNSLLLECAKKGMHHILVEAGATLAKLLFETPNSFNKFLLWTSPLRLGNGLSINLPLNANLTLNRTYMQGRDFCLEFLYYHK